MKKGPYGACVGKIDKFQGHEAAVVLISMAISSGDYQLRNIEFLYGQEPGERSDFAGEMLAVVVASPGVVAYQMWLSKYSRTLKGCIR